jgi:hypothetical protein
MRTCHCDHAFPICACCEGLYGPALLARSRWLSSVAGWPSVLTADGLAEVERLLRPAPARPAGDCGCSGQTRLQAGDRLALSELAPTS